MARNRILITCAIASLALGLSACSSDDGPATMMPGAQMEVDKVVPTGTTIPLPAGLADDETFTAAEGETVTIEDIGVFECASATCTVDIADNVLTVTGDIKVVSLADDLPADVLAALTDVAEEVVELTPLEAAKTAAADAATAAMTAAGTAGDAVAAADTARENAATMQTNESSYGHAKMARDYADEAEAEYMKAMAASAAAAAAEDIMAATRALVDAEKAMAAAETAATGAAKHAQLSMDAVANELLIVDKTKSVGDTSITVGTPNSVVTTTVGGKPTTVVTGEIDKVMVMSMEVGGIKAVPGVPDGTPPVAEVLERPGVLARGINLGVRLDSDNDMARLTLVTHYIGTATVGAYADSTDPVTGVDAADAGVINRVPANMMLDHDQNAETDALRIRAASGMFYQADDGVDPVASHGITETDNIGIGAEPTTLYSFVVGDGDDAVTTYLRRIDTHTAPDGTVTHDYMVVDTVMGVKGFPMATAYKHLHYGMWNGLDDKGNMIADLGIGFVNPTADGMMTGSDDMPNVGTADYKGDWVASVREADMDGDGTITEQVGNSMMMADFEENTVMVDLIGLAQLDGTVSGDRFLGTKASKVMAGMGGLTADGTFTGSFNGAFFGPLAAEAGGVFDYTSKDAEDGEFRGAFGADKK